jgi:hypothetical protein
MRRAAQANLSRLPNHNPPRFYTAWTRNGHAGCVAQCHLLTQGGQERPGHDTAFDCIIDCSRFQRGQSFSQRTAR